MKPPTVNGLSRIYNGPAPGWMAVSRGAALGLSMLIGLNLLEVFSTSSSPVENWLSSSRPLTPSVAITVLTMAATALALFAIRPALPAPVWFVAIAAVLGFVALCSRELFHISQIPSEQIRNTAMIRPMGIAMLFIVTGIGIVWGNSDAAKGHSSFSAIVTSAVLTILGFAVVTVQSGGLGDVIEGKPVPAVLVMGCPPDADGKPTDAMVDRVATASQLLSAGDGKILVLSGGSPVADSKESMMKGLALTAGVAETVIVTDLTGQTASASLQFASSMPELRDDRRVAVVSHWYELARIRLLAKRNGLTVIAIPAEQKNALFGQNSIVAKEVGSLLLCLCEPAIALARGGMQTKTPSDEEGVRSKSSEELDEFLTQ